jgi:hypothetical protein
MEILPPLPAMRSQHSPFGVYCVVDFPTARMKPRANQRQPCLRRQPQTPHRWMMVLDFLFSYYGLVTLSLSFFCVVAIYKHLEWWKYLCIAFFHALFYIDFRSDRVAGYYLAFQFVFGVVLAIGLAVLLIYSLFK